MVEEPESYLVEGSTSASTKRPDWSTASIPGFVADHEWSSSSSGSKGPTVFRECECATAPKSLDARNRGSSGLNVEC